MLSQLYFLFHNLHALGSMLHFRILLYNWRDFVHLITIKIFMAQIFNNMTEDSKLWWKEQ
jgi:hypothetical protein